MSDLERPRDLCAEESERLSFVILQHVYTLDAEAEAGEESLLQVGRIAADLALPSQRVVQIVAHLTYAGFVAYVTGAHNFKAGMQVRTGWSEENFETRGDIVQIVSNGVPQSVRRVNTPSGHKESGVNTGIYQYVTGEAASAAL